MALKGRKKEPQDVEPRLRKNLISLYNSVFYWANPEGLQPIGAFLDLPSKVDYPTYTKVVVNPICMNMIEARMKGGLYKKEQELMADLMLMFANCRFFNQEMSQVFQDADTLEKVLVERAKQLELVIPEKPVVEERPILTNEVKAHAQTPGGKSRKSFTPKCPSRKRKVIENTVTPKMKCLKVELKKVDIEREAVVEGERMGRRVKAPVSYIEPSLKDKMRQGAAPRFKIAPKIKSFKVEMKKVEMEEAVEVERLKRRVKEVVSYLEPSLKDKMRRGSVPPPSTRPLPAKSQHDLKVQKLNHKPHNSLGAYKIPKKDKSATSGPALPIQNHVQPSRRSKHSTISLPEKIKALYNKLKYYKDAKGSQLALPFMQLPSRKDYPDYYKVIKNPMDLHMISRKRNKYETLEDAVEDFVLVFDNAMQYNVEGSQIFRNAKTLSRVAQHWRPEEI